MKDIEIPFGAKDSELVEVTYFIPEGMEAVIEGDKVIIRKKESDDEEIRKAIIKYITLSTISTEGIVCDGVRTKDMLAWLEKPKPVWSREDQRNLFELKHRMTQIYHYWKRPIDEKLIDWLDSIKERMQKGE